jgi:carboxymethylenebutenolidase
MANSSTTGEVQAGGTDMQIFTFTPDGGGKRPAVIVIQEIFGVNDHMKDVANRYADAGFVAAAPDLFHREGPGCIVPFDDMKQGSGIRGKLSNDDIIADVTATVEYLKNDPNVDGDNIGIVGFCFGGMVSYLAAASVPGIGAAAIYYGGGILPRPDAPADAPRLLDATADSINVPMIGFWGDQDGGIPAENVALIESTLKGKGKDYESHTYAGAGHGFFCDARGSYNEAAAKDAFPRTVEFFKKNLA